MVKISKEAVKSLNNTTNVDNNIEESDYTIAKSSHIGINGIDGSNITEEEIFDNLIAVCDQMGISYTANDTITRLQIKINSRLRFPKDLPVEPEVNGIPVSRFNATKDSSASSVDLKLRKECLRLVRIKVTNLYPQEKNLKGSIFTWLSSEAGEIKYFVPFGEACGEHGVYIPVVIVDWLKSAKYIDITEGTHPDNPRIKIPKSVKKAKYFVEELPPLTIEQIKALSH